MERFLSQCAAFIFSKHSQNLRDICLVFPNRRAGVFFKAYLGEMIAKPEIAPEITTVSEFISGFSGLMKTERLYLIARLYDIFRKHTGSNESFDEFYFWGETLISDFNDIDHYLVNAEDLFSNLTNLKLLESHFEYLSPEQKKALEYFWGSIPFSGDKEFHRIYLSIWEKLYPVYNEFREFLLENGLGYKGLIDRQAVEQFQKGEAPLRRKKYYFIGLNALNNCEKTILRLLKENGMAEFIWDYDRYYLDDEKNDAGLFLRENLLTFPQARGFATTCDNFVASKKISITAVASLVGQIQEISHFLSETVKNGNPEFDSTAIILADESLLLPALNAIPEKYGELNITMGYPVANSVVFGFVQLLISLLKHVKTDKEGQKNVYYRYVTDILNHQLLSETATETKNKLIETIINENKVSVNPEEFSFSPLHKTIFHLPDGIANYCDYFLEVLNALKMNCNHIENQIFNETVFSISQSVEKLKSVIEMGFGPDKGIFSDTVFFRLFNQYVGKETVAFEGEPLSGIQIMGMLETRCLDFENLLIIGLNEGNWPGPVSTTSFIPHSIRMAFGLPGIKQQNAMFAYYFYRLLQKSDNISITYNVSRDGISTGELSRLGLQLIYSSPNKPELKNLEFCFAPGTIKTIEIPATDEISAMLIAGNSAEKPISPSAISTFVSCSLKFYFKYILKLPEPEIVVEEIDGQLFGKIIHEALEKLYAPFTGRFMAENDLAGMNETAIEGHILKALNKNLYGNKKQPLTVEMLEGTNLLFLENAKLIIRKIVETDKKYLPLKIIGLEKRIVYSVDIQMNGEVLKIYVGGIMDRFELCDGSARVTDYKTGKVDSMNFSSVEELFDSKHNTHKKEILQTLIYSWLVSRVYPEFPNPHAALYSLKGIFSSDFDPYIKKDKKEFAFHEIEDELIDLLKVTIAQMFSPTMHFTQTTNPDKCKICSYNTICMKK